MRAGAGTGACARARVRACACACVSGLDLMGDASSAGTQWGPPAVSSTAATHCIAVAVSPCGRYLYASECRRRGSLLHRTQAYAHVYADVYRHVYKHANGTASRATTLDPWKCMYRQHAVTAQ